MPGSPISKSDRRRRIREIMEKSEVSDQGELVKALKSAGMKATQATVSRDLREMGAHKAVMPSGNTAYVLGGSGNGDMPAMSPDRVLREWVLSMDCSGNMVVLRTPPGSAHVVASALDRSQKPEVAGCIAGDDTVFVLVREKFSIKAFMKKLANSAGLNK